MILFLNEVIYMMSGGKFYFFIQVFHHELVDHKGNIVFNTCM